MSGIQHIKKEFLILSAIIIITIIAFSPTFENGFTNWDDNGYVTENLDIKKEWNEKIGIFFSEYFMGNYHPFTMISLAIDYQIDGLNPLTFHITNLILHLINTLLVFWFILLLLKSVNYKRSLEIALITSALFGVHTLHVESVAWISERKDVLYSMFFLLSLIAYLKYVNIKKSKFLIFSLVLFLFSLLSKGQAVSLTITLILIDYFLGRKLLSKKVILEKISFFALSGVFGVIAIYAQQSSNTINSNIAFSFYERILFACYGFIQYITKLVVPVNLSAFYPYPKKINGSLTYEFWLYFLAVICIIGLFIYLIKKQKKDLVFGILFFTINIFLVLQFLPVGHAIMADRYSYLPSIGVFLIIGIGIKWVLETQKKPLIAIVKSLSVLYLIFLVILTMNRTKVWNNSMVLWNDVIEKDDGIAIAYNNRGTENIILGNYENAIIDFNKSILLVNYDHATFNNRGSAYLNLRNYKLAERDFKNAIALKSDYLKANYNLGLLYENTQNYKKAVFFYNKIDNSNSINLQQKAYKKKGNIYLFKLEAYQKAIIEFEKALELNNSDYEIFNNIGVAQHFKGNLSEAIIFYRKALLMAPENSIIFLNLGIANIELGNLDKGCQYLNNSLKLGNSEAKEKIEINCKK